MKELAASSSVLVHAPFEMVRARFESGPEERTDDGRRGGRREVLERSPDSFVWRVQWPGTTQLWRMRRVAETEWEDSAEFDTWELGKFSVSGTWRLHRAGTLTRLERTVRIVPGDGTFLQRLRFSVASKGHWQAGWGPAAMARQLETEYFVDFGGPLPEGTHAAPSSERWPLWSGAYSGFSEGRNRQTVLVFLAGLLALVVGSVALLLTVEQTSSPALWGTRVAGTFVVVVLSVLAWTSFVGMLDAIRTRRTVEIRPHGLELTGKGPARTFPWSELDLSRARVVGYRLEIPCPADGRHPAPRLWLSHADARRLFDSTDRPPAAIPADVLARFGMRRPASDRSLEPPAWAAWKESNPAR